MMIEEDPLLVRETLLYEAAIQEGRKNIVHVLVQLHDFRNMKVFGVGEATIRKGYIDNKTSPAKTGKRKLVKRKGNMTTTEILPVLDLLGKSAASTAFKARQCRWCDAPASGAGRAERNTGTEPSVGG